MKRSRGFTLTELLMALAVLTIFLNAAQQVFFAVEKSYNDLSTYDARSSELNAALSRLRADCWDAKKLDIQAQAIAIQTSAGKQITWKISDDQSLQRSEDQQVTTYESAGHGLSFASDGPLLLVVTQAPGGPRGVPMVSQAMQLAGGQP